MVSRSLISLSLYWVLVVMSKVILLVGVLTCFGCSFGSPKYVKLNKNGSFLLTQDINKDIICIKDQTKKGMRCYYVNGKHD